MPRSKDVAAMTFDEGVAYFSAKVPGLDKNRTNQQKIDQMIGYYRMVGNPNNTLKRELYRFLTQVCKYDHLEL